MTTTTTTTTVRRRRRRRPRHPNSYTKNHLHATWPLLDPEMRRSVCGIFNRVPSFSCSRDTVIRCGALMPMVKHWSRDRTIAPLGCGIWPRANASPSCKGTFNKFTRWHSMANISLQDRWIRPVVCGHLTMARVWPPCKGIPSWWVNCNCPGIR